MPGTVATTVVGRLLGQLRSDVPVGVEGVELAAELVVRESSAGVAPGS
ncbi:hypothetical protein [Kitasatospora purpeofusca]